MREKPILFSGPMVRAILDGRKTQTRRAVKPQPSFRQSHEWRGRTVRDCESRGWVWKDHDFGDGDAVHAAPGSEMAALCPYGQPGDRLWVRETWAKRDDCVDGGLKAKHYLHFRASYNGHLGSEWHYYGHWRPSIHMPRWASRITLDIVSVRVERLNDISEADAIAEGLTSEGGAWSVTDGYWCSRCVDPRHTYEKLWEHINGVGSWTRNPWVWVVEFQIVGNEGKEANDGSD